MRALPLLLCVGLFAACTMARPDAAASPAELVELTVLEGGLGPFARDFGQSAGTRLFSIVRAAGDLRETHAARRG